MTTNIDRVVEVIMKSIVMVDERLALDIARTLHDEGLLAPDPQEDQ